MNNLGTDTITATVFETINGEKRVRTGYLTLNGNVRNASGEDRDIQVNELFDARNPTNLGHCLHCYLNNVADGILLRMDTQSIELTHRPVKGKPMQIVISYEGYDENDEAPVSETGQLSEVRIEIDLNVSEKKPAKDAMRLILNELHDAYGG